MRSVMKSLIIGTNFHREVKRVVDRSRKERYRTMRYKKRLLLQKGGSADKVLESVFPY